MAWTLFQQRKTCTLLGASSLLCYKQLGREWVHQYTTVLYLILYYADR